MRFNAFPKIFKKHHFFLYIMDQQTFEVLIADERHLGFAQFIADEMEASAKARGTGIAKRDPEYIRLKIREGKAVIAFDANGTWAGFCYIETWSHGKFVANSGLIVAPAYRRGGLAKQIKREIFKLSRKKYPDSKIFGLTTGLAVMKINSDLGYEPVTYSELTNDPEFWKGCKSCVNYDILTSKEFKNCLCTAMLYDPAEEEAKKTLSVPPQAPPPPSDGLFERFLEKVRAIADRVKSVLDGGQGTALFGLSSKR
jgi:GNAT superfamily N-acetyltransferase